MWFYEHKKQRGRDAKFKPSLTTLASTMVLAAVVSPTVFAEQGCPAGYQPNSQNLIANGDFSAGLSGWTSEWLPDTDSSQEVPPNNGVRAMSGTVTAFNIIDQQAFAGDSANGVDGVATWLYSNGNDAGAPNYVGPKTEILAQTISDLIAGETYVFAGYYSNAIINTADLIDDPIISVEIDGAVVVEPTTAVEDAAANWHRMEGTFTAGTASVGLSIFDSATGGAGDDMGTTALSIYQCQSIAQAGFDLSAGSLTFDETTVGTTATSKTVSITNSGDAELTLNSITPTDSSGDYVIDTSGCGATLAAGASCDITVEFTPTTAGSKTATIAVSTSAGDATVGISGVGVEVPVGALNVTPASLVYGNVTLGSSSASQTVTVTNEGPGPLELESLTLTGTGYSISETDCSVGEIAATESCEVEISFAPSAVGLSQGMLVIETDLGNRTINLSGAGVAAPVGQLQILPANVVFEDTTVGEEGNTATITLSNVGAAPIDLDDADVSEGYEIVSNTCEGVAVLAAQESCEVVVKFVPTTEGLQAGELTIGSRTVGLAGEGQAAPVPVLQVSPASIAFDATPVGVTADEQVLSVANIGGAELTVSALTLAGVAVMDYAVVADACTGEVLAGGESCDVAYNFTPTVEGLRRASVDVSTTAGNDAVDLIGFAQPALAGLLTVNPDTQLFGNITVNTDSDAKTVVVTNSGTAAADISSITLGGEHADAFSYDAADCGASLEAAASCDISVVFAPEAIGAMNATLTVASAEGDAVTTLSGYSTAAPTGMIAVDPAVLADGLDFGNILINSSSDEMLLEISNNGAAPLTITAITALDGSSFTLDAQQCLAAAIEAGESCSVPVTFGPSVAGVLNSVVSIESDDPSQSRLNVALIGIGSTGDRDNDGLADNIEENSPTDPDNPDTDGDGLLDGLEDADLNGEFDEGETNANDADTDDDGLQDGIEDTNKDGIRQDSETDPRIADTDGDGLLDGIEDADQDGRYETGETDPLNTDTDSDGIPDGQEDLNLNGQFDDGETDPRTPEGTVEVVNVPTAVLGDEGTRLVQTGLEGGAGAAGLPLLGLFAGMAVLRRRRLGLARSVVIGGVSALALAAPVQAAEDDFYLGLGLGASQLEPNENSTGFVNTDNQDIGGKVFVGYDIRDSISVEGYYADLGAATLNNGTIEGDISYQMMGINGLWYLPNSLPGWKGFAKVGAGSISNDSDTISFEQLEDVQITAGLGLEWMAKNGWGVRGDYDFFDKDVQFLSLNVLKRFGYAPVVIPAPQPEPAPAPEPIPEPIVITPLDSDGDGVYDDSDKCPGTATGVTVNVDGCPLDSDGDGVPNAADQCPNTPAGFEVDSRGCSLDSDGDGVADALDQCPSTPRGVEVSQNGCEIRQAVEVERFSGILDGVNFHTASAELTLEARNRLDRLADQLLQYPDARIIVVGHTDNVGHAQSNLDLSNARARSVANYLVSRGLLAQNMRYVGKGEAEPIASNDNREGRLSNRRVELVVR